MEKIIVGDWNTDIQCMEAPVYKSFSKCCDLLGLTQLITLPTRVCELTQSTIDLIVTSDRLNIKNSGVMVYGLSDHYLTFCTRKLGKHKANGHITAKSRCLKTYASENLNLKLAEWDWSPVLKSNQVDEAWNCFKTSFLSILNDIAPLRTVRIKARSEPWMNPELLAAIKYRDQKYSE